MINNEELTEKQQAVLDFIRRYMLRRGFAPTLREITGHFDLASPQSASKYLDILAAKGFIKRAPNSSRAIELPSLARTLNIPILGTINAGPLDLAEENIEGFMSLDSSIAPDENMFLLRVRGDSMAGDNICDGDLALIRPQPTALNHDIVAVLVDGEATLKRFFRDKNIIRLEPSNPRYQPIIVSQTDTSVRIAGRAVAIIRHLKNPALPKRK